MGVVLSILGKAIGPLFNLLGQVFNAFMMRQAGKDAANAEQSRKVLKNVEEADKAVSELKRNPDYRSELRKRHTRD